MVYDPRVHHRRSIRLQGYDYTQAGAYFITLGTYGREPLFGRVQDGQMYLNAVGEMVAEEWERLERRFPSVELDVFCVMPDHMHAILVLADRGAGRCRAAAKEQFGAPVVRSVPTLIRSYKSGVTQRNLFLHGRDAVPLWQRNYYEHVIRNEAELERIRRYIIENPARWGRDTGNEFG